MGGQWRGNRLTSKQRRERAPSHVAVEAAYTAAESWVCSAWHLVEFAHGRVHYDSTDRPYSLRWLLSRFAQDTTEYSQSRARAVDRTDIMNRWVVAAGPRCHFVESVEYATTVHNCLKQVMPHHTSSAGLTDRVLRVLEENSDALKHKLRKLGHLDLEKVQRGLTYEKNWAVQFAKATNNAERSRWAANIEELNSSTAANVPYFDKESRQLLLGDHVIKKFLRNPSANQTTILRAFQEDGWPRRIDDPLPVVGKQVPQRRLSSTIAALNQCQRGDVKIRFRMDGTGKGVTWEIERK